MLEKIRKYKIILKCLVALVLLWYIFRKIDLPVLYSIIKGADFYLLGLAFILIVLNQMLVSIPKWSMILKMYGTSLPYRKLKDLYFTGMFFSMFLPGAYGGDVVRAYQVSKYTKKSVEGFMSVFIERITGVVGLFIILLVALIIADHSVIPLTVKLFGVGLIIISFFSALLVFSKGIMKKLSFLFVITGESFEKKAREIYETIDILRDRKGTILMIFMSVMFQFIAVLINYIIAISLNVNISLGYLMLTIPIIFLISTIPITLNGIGVRDLSYIGLLGLVGVNKESAFSIGFVLFLMLMTVSLYGGFIYIRQK